MPSIGLQRTDASVINSSKVAFETINLIVSSIEIFCFCSFFSKTMRVEKRFERSANGSMKFAGLVCPSICLYSVHAVCISFKIVLSQNDLLTLSRSRFAWIMCASYRRRLYIWLSWTSNVHWVYYSSKISNKISLFKAEPNRPGSSALLSQAGLQAEDSK